MLGVLFGLQMLEGTKLLTSLAYCAFIVVMTDAFNACGGLVYPSGSYIFFAGLLTVIVGGIAKTALGESLDSHVYNAQRSMLVYLAGACTLWVAARISAVLRRKRPFLGKMQLTSNLDQVAVGALLVGFFGAQLIPVAYRSTFNQFNQFVTLSLMLAVYSNTKKSNGNKSSSVFAFLLWLGTTVMGIFVFSKTGIFTPSLGWAIGATLGGYRLTVRRGVFAAALFGLMSVFLTPISQVGRIYLYSPNANEMALDMLLHPLRTRELYEQQQVIAETAIGYHWFEHSEGLLDRLTLFPIDDALIHRTDLGYSPGILPILSYIQNMIPRYLVGTKTVLHWGNQYAHEIGLLGKNDTNTGVSFSPFSDAYHEMQWWGVTLVSLPIFLVMFWFCDSLTGSTKDTIWAAMYTLLFAHTASEGAMGTPFAAISTAAFLMCFLAFMSRYVLQVIGSILIPTSRVQAQPVPVARWRPRTAPILTVPRTIEDKL
jgi:hypothetical protein